MHASHKKTNLSYLKTSMNCSMNLEPKQLHSVIQDLIQESHFPIALLPYSNNLAESKTTSVFQQC